MFIHTCISIQIEILDYLMKNSHSSIRYLRYSAQDYSALCTNQAHQFAAKHALCLYQTQSIYSFIPKNACSTLRLSISLANGCLESAEDFNWIHKNNETFRADLSSLLTAKYTFVFLRCPFARLVSVYLDKIINRTREAWNLYDLLKRKTKIEEYSFKFFISSLIDPNIRNGNIHWRPQNHFLVYKKYDDYFCLEQFPQASKILKDKIGLKIIDARPLTNHGTEKMKHIYSKDYSSIKPARISKVLESGKCPDPKSFYNDELISIVLKYYKTDIELYKKHFSKRDLMFPV